MSVVSSLFSSLITQKTRDEVLAEYVTVLQSVGFPAVSWHSTSVPIRLLTAMAGTHSKFTELLSNVTKGGYLELATGQWLTLLAQSLYQTPRYTSTTTQLYGSIADTASAGPFNFTAGQLRFATASGKVFSNDEAFTVSLDSASDFTVTANATGSTYNIGKDELVTLLTPVAGAGFATHTTVRTTGTSPPTVAVSGTPNGAYEFIVEITTAGALGVGVFKWSSNGGTTYTTGVTLPGGGTYSPVGTGVTITFAAGSYTTDHSYKWNSGCTSFNPRSDCVATTGTDDESDELLRQRCRDKWATLGYGANASWYRYYCKKTPTYGANVTRVKVDTSSLGTGYITITLAGPSGTVDGTTLAAVDTYMQSIKPNCVTLTTQAADEVTITPYGNAYIYTDYVDTALASMEDGMDAYLASVDIGGTAYLSQITDALQYDGEQVRNVSITTPSSDVVLTYTQVPKRGTIDGNVVFHSVSA